MEKVMEQILIYNKGDKDLKAKYKADLTKLLGKLNAYTVCDSAIRVISDRFVCDVVPELYCESIVTVDRGDVTVYQVQDNKTPVELLSFAGEDFGLGQDKKDLVEILECFLVQGCSENSILPDCFKVYLKPAVTEVLKIFKDDIKNGDMDSFKYTEDVPLTSNFAREVAESLEQEFDTCHPISKDFEKFMNLIGAVSDIPEKSKINDYYVITDKLSVMPFSYRDGDNYITSYNNDGKPEKIYCTASVMLENLDVWHDDTFIASSRESALQALNDVATHMKRQVDERLIKAGKLLGVINY